MGFFLFKLLNWCTLHYRLNLQLILAQSCTVEKDFHLKCIRSLNRRPKKVLLGLGRITALTSSLKLYSFVNLLFEDNFMSVLLYRVSFSGMNFITLQEFIHAMKAASKNVVCVCFSAFAWSVFSSAFWCCFTSSSNSLNSFRNIMEILVTINRASITFSNSVFRKTLIRHLPSSVKKILQTHISHNKSVLLVWSWILFKANATSNLND